MFVIYLDEIHVPNVVHRVSGVWNRLRGEDRQPAERDHVLGDLAKVVAWPRWTEYDSDRLQVSGWRWGEEFCKVLLQQLNEVTSRESDRGLTH